MSRIGIARRAIRKLHHARECVSLPARRQILAHMNFQQSRNHTPKCANLPLRPLLVSLGRMFLPSKPKDMNKHSIAPTKSPAKVCYSLLPTPYSLLFIANAFPLSSSFATASFEVDSV